MKRTKSSVTLKAYKQIVYLTVLYTLSLIFVNLGRWDPIYLNNYLTIFIDI